MNKIFLPLTLCILFISEGCFAQENESKDTDKKISGIDYSYYRKDRAGRDNSQEEATPQANIVKIGLTRWISGVIPFYYERRVTKFLSLQFGVGLTTRDFMADAITDIAGIFGNYSPEDYNNTAFYGQAGRKASVGVYASFQPKFYLTRRRALAGFFVSPMVEFKRFDYQAEYANPIGNINNDDEPTYESSYIWEYRNCVDFTANLGRQWFTGSGVSIELMGGVGFQKIWEFRRYITENANYSNVYSNGTTFSSYFRPEFNLDLNIGGFF